MPAESSARTGSLLQKRILNEIESIRLANGITLEQVASKIGITRSALGRIMKGRTRLSIDMMEMICTALGVGVDQLQALAGRDLSAGAAEVASTFETSGWPGLRFHSAHRDGLSWVRDAVAEHLAAQAKIGLRLSAGLFPLASADLPRLDVSVASLCDCLRYLRGESFEVYDFYRTYLRARVPSHLSVPQKIAFRFMASLAVEEADLFAFKQPEIIKSLQDLAGVPGLPSGPFSVDPHVAAHFSWHTARDELSAAVDAFMQLNVEVDWETEPMLQPRA